MCRTLTSDTKLVLRISLALTALFRPGGKDEADLAELPIIETLLASRRSGFLLKEMKSCLRRISTRSQAELAQRGSGQLPSPVCGATDKRKTTVGQSAATPIDTADQVLPMSKRRIWVTPLCTS